VNRDNPSATLKRGISPEGELNLSRVEKLRIGTGISPPWGGWGVGLYAGMPLCLYAVTPLNN
jgi:hypothetical protein